VQAKNVASLLGDVHRRDMQRLLAGAGD